MTVRCAPVWHRRCPECPTRRHAVAALPHAADSYPALTAWHVACGYLDL